MVAVRVRERPRVRAKDWVHPPRTDDCTAVSALPGLRPTGNQHGGPMTATQLPDHPNLDQLKRQAKDLLHSARANDPAALGRFRILPAFANASDAELTRRGLALHDAQSVIAREY